MRKFYSILFPVAIAFQAGAIPSPPASLKVAPVPSELTTAINYVTANAKAPARADVKPDEDEWTLIGEAKYTDGILYAPYGTKGATYMVPLYQSVENENVYLLMDVYPESSLGSRYWEIDPEAASTLIIDKSLGDDKVSLAYTFNCTDGAVLSVQQVEYGSFEAEVFTFPAQSLYVMNNAGTSKEVMYYNNDVKIALPGAKDFSVALSSASFCGPDNIVDCTLEFGKDVEHARCCILNGEPYAANSINYEWVLADYAVECDAESGVYGFSVGEGWNTLFVLSVDSDGNLLEGAAIWLYGQPAHNDNEWYDLGYTLYTDDTFLQKYHEEILETDPYEVNILENKARPGFFRIVNMMEGHPNSNEFAFTYDFPQYFDINATSAANVSIARQPLGAAMGDSDWALLSFSAGSYVGNMITFPAKGLLLTSQQLGVSYSNKNGNFRVDVPYRVTVTAVDEEGNAIAGAVATCGDTTIDLDDNGNTVFGLPAYSGTGVPLSHTITVSKEGYESFDYTIDPYSKHAHTIAATLKANSGIDAVNVDAGKMEIFNLQGIRVNNPGHGLYIIGGKKVTL